MTEEIECDYLVVGAGASGMAFVDVLLERTDATVAIVDVHARPGGHWNDAYPFVRLHQPSARYGVTSRQLGNDTIDTHGSNKGLYELASGTELVTYFEQVMDQTLLTSGRVQYFPMSRYCFDGTFEALLSGKKTSVAFDTLVDARYVGTSVPSTTPPSYQVDSVVVCIPPNDLPTQRQPTGGFVVVGAGKTAIDTCLFLLEKGVDAGSIKWIRPRDPWLSNRAMYQPGHEFVDGLVHRASTLIRGSATAASIDELFAGFEKAGVMFRIDPEVRPTMWRCSTVTEDEVKELRRITDVVRLGRVQRITTSEVILDEGSVPAADAVYVDCSASGLTPYEPTDIFDGNTVRLQPVKGCQPVFSAAFVAFVEAEYEEQTIKNELCGVVPYPSTDRDWLWFFQMTGRNAARWRREPALAEWLKTMRINLGAPPPDLADPDLLAALAANIELAPAASENLGRLLAASAGDI